ncbi:MAG TPA: hypothetical protein VK797_29010 [Tepidisphaeraceae bacterium]|jgi:hypothetical protein|nr:hypothetical protein [Tepidisphaeraceae bacterium]
MSTNPNDGAQLLRNLTSALREQQKQSPDAPKLPTATDQDILRAMLGKRWGKPTGEQSPMRKAG